jgi:phytoene dehydrogenase-like protein
MTQASRKIVIIGGGIAGLCAGVYGRRCGYQVEVLEQHDRAGGLATSWQRGDYTFETCLHWLLGSNPHRAMYGQWQEVFEIDKLTFVHPDVFVRLETEHGEGLNVYGNVDRMETEFLQQAPQDAREIRRLALAVRRFSRFVIPDRAAPWPHDWLALVRTCPICPCSDGGRR